MKAYHRTDPLMDERKGHYAPAQFGAFVKVQLLAGRQTRRGRFRSVAALKAMLPSAYARHVEFLVEQGDLIPASRHAPCDQCPPGPPPRGEVYIDGWDEWQEGDLTVGERMRVLRERHGIEPRKAAMTKGMPRTSGAERTAAWRLRNRVFERDNFTCRYCGKSDYPRGWLVADHVIPSPDGPTTEDNLVTACRGCNKRKGGRTPEQAGMPLRDVSHTASHVTDSDVSPAIGIGVGSSVSSPANAGDAREVDDLELAVRRLRHGNATEGQLETMRGFVEQLDEATVLGVLNDAYTAKAHDRYGIAQSRLVQLAARRKRGRGSTAVTPLTNYDSLIVSDDDDAAGAA